MPCPRTICSVRSRNQVRLITAAFVLLSHLLLSAQVITDTARDFSNVQGSNGWTYGFYTTPFTLNTFQALEIYETNSGGHAGWMHVKATPPWTRVTASELHPAAPNDSSLPIE